MRRKLGLLSLVFVFCFGLYANYYAVGNIAAASPAAIGATATNLASTNSTATNAAATNSTNGNSAATDPNPAAKNLILNGDFSSTGAKSGNWGGASATSWSNWVPGKKDAGTFFVQDGALCVSATATYRVAVHQTVKGIDASKTYVVSVDATANLSAGKVLVRIQSVDASNKGIETLPIQDAQTLTGSGSKTLTKEFKPKEGAAGIKVELFFENAIGTASFDNVVLHEKLASSDAEDTAVGAVAGGDATVGDEAGTSGGNGAGENSGSGNSTEVATSPLAMESGTIALDTTKLLTPALKDALYHVVDPSVLTHQSGFLYPKKEGTTEVKIYRLTKAETSPTTSESTGTERTVAGDDRPALGDDRPATGGNRTTATDDNTVPEGAELLGSFTVTVEKATEDEFSLIRARWDETSFGSAHYVASVNPMKDLLERLDTSVAANLALWQEPLGNKSPFTDLDFSRSAHLTTVYRRLEQFAQQLKTPASKYYQNVDLAHKMKSAMEWLYQHVYNENIAVPIPTGHNWWDYEIGAPRAVADTLIYGHAYFTQAEIDRYCAPIKKLVPEAEWIQASYGKRVAATGGNQTDISKVTILQGALTRDADRIKAGVQGLTTVTNYVEIAGSGANGFYRDGSFLEHNRVAYTGGYGNVLLEGFSQLLPLIQNSSFALPTESTSILYTWIREAFMPVIVRGEEMDMVRGRSVSREAGESHVQAVEVLRSVARLAKSADEATRLELQAWVKQQVSSDTFYDVYKNLKSYNDMQLFLDIAKDDKIQTSQNTSFIKAFNNMDKLIYSHGGSNWTLALSMYSARTQNFEFMNRENAKGWYSADGMLYLYNSDLSHYSNNWWATVDPYYLAGTTVLDAPVDASKNKNNLQRLLPSSFVGTAQLDNTHATAAMELSSTLDTASGKQTLTANKAWFINNDSLIALGSNITANASSHTTIENRKLLSATDSATGSTDDRATDGAASNYKVFVNGKEVSLGAEAQRFDAVTSVLLQAKDPSQSIGYVFFNKPSLSAKIETRNGSWKDINASQSEDLKSNTFFTLWQEHAVATPQEANSYAYTLLPAATQADLDAYAAQVEIISNTPSLQVVHDRTSNTYSVVKYDDSTTTLEAAGSDGIVLHKRGLYVVQKEASAASYEDRAALVGSEDTAPEVPLDATAETMAATAEPTTVEEFWKLAYYQPETLNAENGVYSSKAPEDVVDHVAETLQVPTAALPSAIYRVRVAREVLPKEDEGAEQPDEQPSEQPSEGSPEEPSTQPDEQPVAPTTPDSASEDASFDTADTPASSTDTKDADTAPLEKGASDTSDLPKRDAKGTQNQEKQLAIPKTNDPLGGNLLAVTTLTISALVMLSGVCIFSFFASHGKNER